MPRLNRLNRLQVKDKIEQYPQRYVNDWIHWLRVKMKTPNNIPTVFGKTLRKWQACRPNTMRRTKHGAKHTPHF